jgi:hypothetical protein
VSAAKGEGAAEPSVAAALVRQLKRATVVTAQQTDAIGVCDSFTEAEYRLLKNDKLRNEMFADAIAHVAARAPGLFRWADMGTGGFAFLSVHILEAFDAHRVTAVEVQQDAFESAGRWLREKCRDGARFRVLHSVCSSVGLAEMVDGEPCDAMVGELVGNIASSEGIVAAVADWRARGLCRPGAVFVPGKVATYYRLAHLKGAHFRRGTRSSPTRVSSTIALVYTYQCMLPGHVTSSYLGVILGGQTWGSYLGVILGGHTWGSYLGVILGFTLHLSGYT